MFKIYKVKSVLAKFIIALCVSQIVCITTINQTYATPVGYTEKQPKTDMISIKINCNIFGHVYEDIEARLYNGRLYIPLVVLRTTGYMSASNTGLMIAIDGVKHILLYNKNQAIPNILVVDNEVYLNAFELSSCLGAVIDIDSANNRVSLYKKSDSTLSAEASCKVFSREKQYDTAYIRLEDIMADGMDTQADPKYTDRNLLAVRELADVMHQNNQQYYVAWIPVFVDPSTDYTNNPLYERNLYNADFLGTLDYFSTHGGRIGLHGYTHQYGEYASADGWEWGAETPLSEDEQESRMVYAKNTAEMLGIKYCFFEFPHYGATTKQMAMAEKYFDVIYQRYQNVSETGLYNHNDTYWIPTPANYIFYDGSVPETIKLVKEQIRAGKIYSLFYHPTLDFNKLQVSYNEDEINISGQGSTNLFSLLNETEKLGYSFHYWLS